MPDEFAFRGYMQRLRIAVRRLYVPAMSGSSTADPRQASSPHNQICYWDLFLVVRCEHYLFTSSFLDMYKKREGDTISWVDLYVGERGIKSTKSVNEFAFWGICLPQLSRIAMRRLHFPASQDHQQLSLLDGPLWWNLTLPSGWTSMVELGFLLNPLVGVEENMCSNCYLQWY